MTNVLIDYLRRLKVDQMEISDDQTGSGSSSPSNDCADELGRYIDAKDESGKTPLMLACSDFCHYALIELLVGNGAQINEQDDNGDTAIMLIAKKAKLRGQKVPIEVESSSIYQVIVVPINIF